MTGVTAAIMAAGALMASPAIVDACAGLIGSNGAVNLGRTTTLAAYHNGEEHYVTSFEFAGEGAVHRVAGPEEGAVAFLDGSGHGVILRIRVGWRAGIAGRARSAAPLRRNEAERAVGNNQ